ncbi:hypothetical protein [Fusobacterium hwasookii]|uniref:Uncharacterized protein n=1 Tax=Fusobacterium hwasookii ChDC F128 TaxID=1216362 RepID=A0ABP2R899_9FUSO|nr:hypothetical protein [Fusobacterium hwasookii]EJU08395.1 hypothetical protein B437_03721 [Fusobacterium hwasookii ChDC F128]QNE66170.1 hypothetical protein H5V36_10105 [Fusobacterium hwasookii]
MEIIKLPSEIKKLRKQRRSKNLKKNKNAYRILKEMIVPNELKLWQFRKYYHPVLSIKEKDIVLNIGLDPWSVEGLKYIGDCKRFKINLGEPIPD